MQFLLNLALGFIIWFFASVISYYTLIYFINKNKSVRIQFNTMVDNAGIIDFLFFVFSVPFLVFFVGCFLVSRIIRVFK